MTSSFLSRRSGITNPLKRNDALGRHEYQSTLFRWPDGAKPLSQIILSYCKGAPKANLWISMICPCLHYVSTMTQKSPFPLVQWVSRLRQQHTSGKSVFFTKQFGCVAALPGNQKPGLKILVNCNCFYHGLFLTRGSPMYVFARYIKQTHSSELFQYIDSCSDIALW